MTRYAYVRLCIFLILGILLHELTDAYIIAFLIAFCVLLTAYCLLFIAGKTFFKHLQLNTLLGFLAFGIVFCFGYLNTFQKTVSHKTSNLIHFKNPVIFYKGIITAEVREREKFFQTEVQISSVKDSMNWYPVSGKIMLNIRKSDSLKLNYGDEILVGGSPQLLPDPLNPEQFNYKKYLSHQQIYHQHFIQPNRILVTGNHPPNRIIQHALAIRKYFDHRLAELIPSEQEYAIATGVILGVKDVLDNDLKQAYASAGAMHILAVSGMQVALFYQLLVFLLGKVRKIKHGNLIFAAVVLLTLWFYSFVTGLSASVLRAIVMFSFIVIAETFQRKTNIYNTLAVSAFVLLCFNPYLIMDVGFQLSYLAVGGIVYFYPVIYPLLSVKSKILDFFWKITCVGIAAQILTVPVSLYHFHQFPVYFLLANLILIPVSTGILYLGLATLVASFIPYVSVIFGFLLKWSIWILNQSVFITENLPGALITGIDINVWETVLLYGAIVFLCFLFEYRKFYWMVLSTTCLTIVSISSIYESFVQKKQKELAVFSINKHPVLNIITGQKNIFITDSVLLANEPSWGFNLKAHWYKMGVNYKTGNSGLFQDLGKYYPTYSAYKEYGFLIWEKKKFLILYSPVENLENVMGNVEPDYVIVQHNAIRNLKNFAGMKVVFVLDASNTLYNTQRLKKQARDLNLILHAVNIDGAFVLSES